MSTSGTPGKKYGMSKTAGQRRNKTGMKPPQSYVDKQIMKDAGSITKGAIGVMVNQDMTE